MKVDKRFIFWKCKCIEIFKSILINGKTFQNILDFHPENGNSFRGAYLRRVVSSLFLLGVTNANGPPLYFFGSPIINMQQKIQ